MDPTRRCNVKTHRLIQGIFRKSWSSTLLHKLHALCFAKYRCFCYSKTGTRIFGFDWKDKSDKMKCRTFRTIMPINSVVIRVFSSAVCSRLVDDLKKNPDNMDMTYHCSPNGNFEPLQCNRGLCYCANVYSGQPISYSVAEQWWTTLPCCNWPETKFHKKAIR